MELTNEDLLAISQLLDTKLDARLQPIENRLKRIEVDLLENSLFGKVFPKLLNSFYHEYLYISLLFMQFEQLHTTGF